MSPAASKHRAEVQPRYGRLAALGAALAVTVIAVLGGTGVLASASGDKPDPVAQELCCMKLRIEQLERENAAMERELQEEK